MSASEMSAKPVRRWGVGVVTGALACAFALAACAQDTPGAVRPTTLTHASRSQAKRVALKASASPTPTGPLRVAALGDSVPSGLGASSFVPMVGKALAAQQHRGLVVSNEAVAGSDSSQVARSLTDPNGSAIKAVRSADVTIIEVGANDFDESQAQRPTCAPVRTAGCYSDDVATVRRDLMTIVTAVKKDMKPGARIVLVGYWNIFKDGAAGQGIGAGYVAQGRALARWVNSTIASVAQQQGVTYADVYSSFLTGKDVTSELQPDGDHPNLTGHQVIADAVLASLGSSARV